MLRTKSVKASWRPHSHPQTRSQRYGAEMRELRRMMRALRKEQRRLLEQVE
jgi:hypothetical protein